MILATVGAQQHPFNRLMTWIETVINRGFIDEDVIVQYGSCTHLPSGIKCYQHLKTDLFNELSSQARLIVTHCDSGLLPTLDKSNKPYILIPRAQCYKEHIDDRQIELASSLATVGVPIAWSPGDLVRFIASPHRISLSTIKVAANEALSGHLKQISG